MGSSIDGDSRAITGREMSSKFATVIERFLITSTNTVLRAELPIVLTAGADALTQTSESVERNHIQYILDVTA